jgi:hypothetical protein
VTGRDVDSEFQLKAMVSLIATTSGLRQQLNSKEKSNLAEVIGFDWCGSIIEYKLVPFADLNKEELAKFWQEWSLLCCWYEIVGGSRPIQKLRNKIESCVKKINQLLLEPQSQLVSDQMKLLSEEKRNIEGHIQFLQV